jgi:hypothetical protein
MIMYAISPTYYRTINSADELQAGESSSDTIPQSLLDYMQGQLVTQQVSQMLRDCDWTQMVDANLPAQNVTAWASYRSLLREVTSQSGYPNTIAWPVPPGSSNTGMTAPR